jgi:hypothetical protein
LQSFFGVFGYFAKKITNPLFSLLFGKIAAVAAAAVVQLITEVHPFSRATNK